MAKEAVIEVGALGMVRFPKGYYVYTGRAARGLQKRVERHLRREKRRHWHIDYLLEKGNIVDVVYFAGRMDECIINMNLFKRLKGARQINGFGSSDCKCKSHLIWTREMPRYDQKALP
jgi:Uri superfamily endonuclease